MAIISTFTSCEKTDLKDIPSSTENTTINNSLFNRNSTVGVEQIFEWLDEQKSEVTAIKNSIIDTLKSSSIFEQMWVEELNEEENLIIVPLSSDFHSQHNAEFGPKNYLLFIENAAGQIRKGNIVQYIPENGNTFPNLPVGTFHDLYNHKDLEADGTYAFLSVGDVFQYDFTIGEGKTVASRFIDRNSEGLDPNCTHWYEVTPTYYYENGQLDHIEYDITDLGVSCTSCPPNQMCDELDGSGILVGSSGPIINNPIESKAVDWIVAHAINNSWVVSSFETLKARKDAASIAHFTSVAHDNSAISTIIASPNNSGLPFANWSPLQWHSRFEGIGNYVAEVTCKGSVNYWDGIIEIVNGQTAFGSVLEFP